MFVMMLCSGSHVCFLSLVKSVSVSFDRHCLLSVYLLCLSKFVFVHVVRLNLLSCLFH